MSDTPSTTGPGSSEEPTASIGPGSTTPAPGEGQAPNRRTLWIVLGVVLGLVVIAAIWWFQGNVKVPMVTGLQQAAATASLDAAGLAVGRTSSEPTLSVEPGTVLSQSPKPGMTVREGTNVDLVVAEIPVASVPDVVGKSSSQAEADLAVAGLRVGEVTAVYTTDDKAGTVLTQSPQAATEVPIASAVALEISAGPKQGAVPNVTGLTSVDANDVLDSAGFAVKETKKESADVAAGVVISQSPAAGTVAQEGITVTLTVSTGAPPAAVEPAPPATDGGDQTEPPPVAEAPAEPESPPASETPAEPDTPPVEKPGQKPETSLTEVPDLIGMRVLEALGALRKADLQFSIEWGPTEEDILRIIEQDPTAGADVDKGTVVNITIGLPSFLFEGAQVKPLPAEPAGGAQVQPLPAEPAPGAEEPEEPSDASTSAP